MCRKANKKSQKLSALIKIRVGVCGGGVGGRGRGDLSIPLKEEYTSLHVLYNVQSFTGQL